MMMPLPIQFGIPGGPEVMVILLLTVIAIVPAYYVYNDAKKRNNENVVLWTVGTVLGALTANIFGALLMVALYHIIGRN